HTVSSQRQMCIRDRLPVEQVAQLVAEYTHRPLARFLGQPVVNIVELNLALDALQGHRAK
ncbi:potassium-transporting ATPase subunit C, partial [Salmonella enterica subsp. enterica serovar Typhimurium]|nr:potassium-transporting ATPase subunit C [Salmonella enterica subsp. enterica serovar Typhimurium]